MSPGRPTLPAEATVLQANGSATYGGVIDYHVHLWRRPAGAA
jgi:predicted amidohydrolase